MAGDLQQEVRVQLVSKCYQMPTLPHVATQALALAQDDDSTARQLSDLICQDQALATNLLRMANSPAYVATQSIVSLQQAITRLGMQTVAELAVTICVRGSIFPKKRFAELGKSLWAHSLGSALFAKEIARQQRRNVEAAYLCGLLHQIGMPLVLKAIAEVRGKKDEQPTSEEVRVILSELHVDVGSLASRTWELPGQVLASVQHCTNYEAAGGHRHLAAVVNLAHSMTDALLADEGFDGIKELAVLEELSIYPDQLDKLIAHHERIALAVA